jgi:hypothetical protein
MLACDTHVNPQSSSVGLQTQAPELLVTLAIAVRTVSYVMAYEKRGAVPTSTRRGSTARRRAARSRETGPGSRATRIGKVRKAFWLDPRLLDEARASLGASSEREAVEMALDLVRFRKELVRGSRALRRLGLSRID